MSTATARVVEAAEAFLGSIAAFDPSGVTASDCVLVSEAAARVEKASGTLRLLAGARAVDAGAHRAAGVADPAAWLARQGGTTGRDAKGGLELARSLDALPETKSALLEGSVSVAQASEIARAEAAARGHERELLAVAKNGDLTKLRDSVRERTLSGTPPEELHRRRLADRRFRHWRDAVGMVCFDGALPPETGIPFVTRVERRAAQLRRERRRHGAEERFEAHAADALVELVGEEGSAKRSPNTDLVIVCDLYAWRRGHAHEGECCHIVGGGPIPVSLAKELAEDAFLKVVLHDGKDVQRVHHVGRKYTAQLRSALELGPVPSFTGRACVDCGRRWGLQHDHVDPVAHTGPTSVDNVKPRCYPCHQEKTERDREAGLLGPRARARAPRAAAGMSRASSRSGGRRAPPQGSAP